MKLALPVVDPVVETVVVLGPYGVIFLIAAVLLRIPEGSATLGRMTRPGR